MPTKRTKKIPRQVGISDEAIAAWLSGDYWGLHRALRLAPWQMPEWSDDPPDEGWKTRPLHNGPKYPDPVVLKASLIEIAGPPPRRWRYRDWDD